MFRQFHISNRFVQIIVIIIIIFFRNFPYHELVQVQVWLNTLWLKTIVILIYFQYFIIFLFKLILFNILKEVYTMENIVIIFIEKKSNFYDRSVQKIFQQLFLQFQ